MSDSAKESRLPPPAFPPGTRRRLNYQPPTPASDGADEPFISPDDPMPDRGARSTTLGPAFISPDDPIPERKIELLDEFRSDVVDSDEEGVVVGMDLDAALDPSEMVEPAVREVIAVVERLAVGLRTRGEASLRMADEVPGLEATLRACCAGYIAGRRAEDLPVIEEPLPTDG